MNDMTHSYVRHDSFIRGVTHSYVRRDSLIHDSFIRETWLIHIWRDMTHSYMRHDSFIYGATWLIHTWDMTLVTWLTNMGWLRLVGSLKLQVSFAKEPYKRDDILQKRPIILRSLLMVATPYLSGYRRKRLHISPKKKKIQTPYTCVPWCIHTCDENHSYVWRDSFICVTWLVDMFDVTHSYVWRDSLICVTW